MADRTDALIVAMRADISQMTKALNQARGITNRKLSEIEQRFDKMNGRIRRSGDDMAADFRRSIAALGVGVAVSQLSGLADSWTIRTGDWGDSFQMILADAITAGLDDALMRQ